MANFVRKLKQHLWTYWKGTFPQQIDVPHWLSFIHSEMNLSRTMRLLQDKTIGVHSSLINYYFLLLLTLYMSKTNKYGPSNWHSKQIEKISADEHFFGWLHDALAYRFFPLSISRADSSSYSPIDPTFISKLGRKFDRTNRQ